MEPAAWEAQVSAFYHIYEELTPEGSGSPYRVFAAYTDASPEFVVLKELDRKRAEIYRRLISLWNPYMAAVYDVQPLASEDSGGRAGEGDCLAVMEYVHGDSLRQYVDKHGPFSERASMQFAIELCEGIALLHRQNILHRDLKPENLIFTGDAGIVDPARGVPAPHLRIIDFGMSEHFEARREYASEVGGTAGFRAPECNDFVASKASDIFSLGCILNFLLTGADPSIKRYRGSAALESILEKATYLDPAFRYSSVEAMERALRHEMRQRFPDGIPILREIPGYRSHCFWKSFLASAYYGLFIRVFAEPVLDRRLLQIVSTLSLQLLIPLFLICDMGHVLHHLPRALRQNPQLLLWLRLVLGILSFLSGFIFYAMD